MYCFLVWCGLELATVRPVSHGFAAVPHRNLLFASLCSHTCVPQVSGVTKFPGLHFALKGWCSKKKDILKSADYQFLWVRRYPTASCAFSISNKSYNIIHLKLELIGLLGSKWRKVSRAVERWLVANHCKTTWGNVWCFSHAQGLGAQRWWCHRRNICALAWSGCAPRAAT